MKWYFYAYNIAVNHQYTPSVYFRNTMPQTRKISTIVFADIAGYTAMMQRDEVEGMDTLLRFRTELERATTIYEGFIVQYFGDGALLAFDETAKAIACTREMQTAFQGALDVPVRMGIHRGEVVFRDNNAFGDTVNLASRVESLGVPGAILVSKSVQEVLEADESFIWQNLGAFEFKNVSHSMEILALSGEGLSIPKREEMMGKLKEKEPVNKWLRAAKWLGIYVFASWGLVQAVAFTLSKIDVSPHWAALLQWILWGMIPSLLIYFVHQERINRNVLKWREKIIFPLNIAALGALIYIVFGTTDFGATTTQVNFAGIGLDIGPQTIVKEEFRTSIPIFSFSQEEGKEEIEWLGSAVKVMLLMDLHQDKYARPVDAGHANMTTVDKIISTKIFHERYVDGFYQKKNDTYIIKPEIHASKSGKLITKASFQGKNLLTVLDSVSVYVREELGLDEKKRAMSTDLNLEEFTSRKPEAIQHFALGFDNNDRKELELATQTDSTFALAWLAQGKLILRWNKGLKEAQYNLDNAYKNRDNLPSEKQLEIMAYRYISHSKWEEAEKLIKIQLEIEPGNQELNAVLNSIYGETRQIDAMYEHASSLFEKEKNEKNGYMLVDAMHIQGKSERVKKEIKPFLALDPQNPVLLTMLMQAHVFLNEAEEAREIKNRIKLLYPDRAPVVDVIDDILAFQADNEPEVEDLQMFTGTYRSHFDEGYMNIWLDENRLIQYYSKQSASRVLPAGKRRIIDCGSWQSWVREYLPNSLGEFDAMRVFQIRPDRRDTFWMWKQTPLITQADSMLRIGNYPGAKEALTIATLNHPRHFYLQNWLAHIQYIESSDSADVAQQNLDLCGKYEDRRVWMEEGKLYLKRTGRARSELLPLSDEYYISRGSLNVRLKIVRNGSLIRGYEIETYDPATETWKPFRDVIKRIS